MSRWVSPRAVGAEDDGVGGQAAVGEPAVQGILEGEQDGPDGLQGTARVEPGLLGDRLLERGALRQLRGEVARAPGLADLDASHDVRVVEPRRGLRLGQEALAELRIPGKLGRQDLQRDAAARAGIPGLEHRAPATLAQAVEHLVVADAGRIGRLVGAAGSRGHAVLLRVAFGAHYGPASGGLQGARPDVTRPCWRLRRGAGAGPDALAMRRPGR